MVHYFTATHPNVEENIRLLFEGEINWLIAGSYSWSDPRVTRDPENPYGYFADSRIEVYYTGLNLEELKDLGNIEDFSNNDKTEILVYCHKRTEKGAIIEQYNLSRYGEYISWPFWLTCNQEARDYEKRKNNFEENGDFEYKIEYNKNLPFPGINIFQFPDDEPIPSASVVAKPNGKKKSCIIC